MALQPVTGVVMVVSVPAFTAGVAPMVVDWKTTPSAISGDPEIIAAVTVSTLVNVWLGRPAMFASSVPTRYGAFADALVRLQKTLV